MASIPDEYLVALCDYLGFMMESRGEVGLTPAGRLLLFLRDEVGVDINTPTESQIEMIQSKGVEDGYG